MEKNIVRESPRVIRSGADDKKTLAIAAKGTMPSGIIPIHKVTLHALGLAHRPLTAHVFDAAGVENAAYRFGFTMKDDTFLWYKTRKPTIIPFELGRLQEKLSLKRLSVIVETDRFPRVDQLIALQEIAMSIMVVVPSGHHREFLEKQFTEYAGIISGLVFTGKKAAQESKRIVEAIPSMNNCLCLFSSQE
jgi:hypothetical protein